MPYTKVTDAIEFYFVGNVDIIYVHTKGFMLLWYSVAAKWFHIEDVQWFTVSVILI